jgi:hypothetical protein
MLAAMPGSGYSDWIYLGMIVFAIAGLLSNRKWGPFVASVVFAAIIAALDLLVTTQTAPAAAYVFLHTILLPLAVTLLYSKR